MVRTRRSGKGLRPRHSHIELSRAGFRDELETWNQRTRGRGGFF